MGAATVFGEENQAVIDDIGDDAEALHDGQAEQWFAAAGQFEDGELVGAGLTIGAAQGEGGASEEPHLRRSGGGLDVDSAVRSQAQTFDGGEREEEVRGVDLRFLAEPAGMRARRASFASNVFVISTEA